MGKKKHYAFLVAVIAIIGVGFFVFHIGRKSQGLSIYLEGVDQIKIMRREYVNYPIMKEDITQFAIESEDDSFIEIQNILSSSIFRRTMKRVNNVSLCGEVSYTIDLLGSNKDEAIHYTIIIDASNMLYVSDSSSMGMVCYQHEIELLDEFENLTSNLRPIE